MAAHGSPQDSQGRCFLNSLQPASWCPFTWVRLVSCVPRAWRQPESPPSSPSTLLHSEPGMPALGTGQTEPREPATSPAQVRREGGQPRRGSPGQMPVHRACPRGHGAPEPACSACPGRACVVTAAFPSTLCSIIPSAPCHSK